MKTTLQDAKSFFPNVPKADTSAILQSAEESLARELTAVADGDAFIDLARKLLARSPGRDRLAGSAQPAGRAAAPTPEVRAVFAPY